MKSGKIAGLAITAAIAGGLALASFWMVRHLRTESCQICRRGIPAQARVYADLRGKRAAVCCARCALTYAEQNQTKLKLAQATDYNTLKRIAPEEAYYVEGSRVVLCEKEEPLLDASRHAQQRVFDRCEPSLFAFARKEDAEAFARQNGGATLRLGDLREELRKRP